MDSAETKNDPKVEVWTELWGKRMVSSMESTVYGFGINNHVVLFLQTYIWPFFNYKLT